MKLVADDCARRLAAADHGVLGTRHATRGVDQVPVCFSMVGARLAVPIDAVKPKTSGSLQRTSNLEADPRASLLCERWDVADWSQLWWVRATLHLDDAPTDAEVLARSLQAKHLQYRNTTFARLLVFDVMALDGWTAGDAR